MQNDLAKRLRIKADMIQMGEKIAWGSDSKIMREAAECIEQAAQEPATGQPVDCRKAFETELAKHPAELFRRHRDQFDSDNYGSMYTQAAWQIFQSAWQPEREVITQDEIKDVLDLASIQTPAGIGYERRCAEAQASSLLKDFDIRRRGSDNG